MSHAPTHHGVSPVNHKHFLPRNFFMYLVVIQALRGAWQVGMAEAFQEPTNEAVGFVMDSLHNLRECMGDAAQLLDMEASDETYEAIDDTVSELLARHVKVYGPNDQPLDPVLATLLAAPTHTAH